MKLLTLIKQLEDIKGLLGNQGYENIDVVLYHPHTQDIQVHIKGATITTATEMTLDLSDQTYYANGGRKITLGDRPIRYNQPIVILEA